MSAPGSGATIFPMPGKSDGGPWYVYIVRCRDNTLYTGITKDLQKRILEHNSGPKGARYTRSRRPVVLVYYEQAESRSVAASREYHLKKLKTSWKHQLVTPTTAPGMDAQECEQEARLRAPFTSWTDKKRPQSREHP